MKLEIFTEILNKLMKQTAVEWLFKQISTR
jgi:hypothetical protein